MPAARSASTLKSLEPFRLELQNNLEPSCLELLRLVPQQGRRVSDSERSAELIRKHDEPTPFLLPKVLTRVSARSESAGARCPLRLERQTASNRSASTLKSLEPFRLEPQNDLEPSCLELLRLAPPTGAAGIGQRTQRGTYSEARRAYSLPLPKVLTRVSARSESAGARCPLRLERQTASNRSASTLKSLERTVSNSKQPRTLCPHFQNRFNTRYSVSRCAGSLPAPRMSSTIFRVLIS